MQEHAIIIIEQPVHIVLTWAMYEHAPEKHAVNPCSSGHFNKSQMYLLI